MSTLLGPTSAVNNSAVTPESSKVGSHKSKTIGIAVGVPVGIILLAIVAVLAFWFARRRGRKNTAGVVVQHEDGYISGPKNRAETSVFASRPESEGHIVPPPAELPDHSLRS
jgi:hypothetical protein